MLLTTASSLRIATPSSVRTHAEISEASRPSRTNAVGLKRFTAPSSVFGEGQCEFFLDVDIRRPGKVDIDLRDRSNR